MMKLSTVESILSTLSTLVDFDNRETVMAELEKERAALEKANERKTAAANSKAEEYAAAYDLVMNALPTSTPATVAEIWAAIGADVPEGFTKGRLQYALSHLWTDSVVKHPGKVNAYTRA